MESIEKCANHSLNAIGDCLDEEPLFEMDCSRFIYNTTGIQSYDDQNFKEIQQLSLGQIGETKFGDPKSTKSSIWLKLVTGVISKNFTDLP